MEYPKITNLLENKPNRPNKFRTKFWVEVNYQSRGTYSINSQVKFKNLMLRSSLCVYSDAYVLVREIVTVAVLGAGGRNNNIQVSFKSCAPFTSCISEINNTEIDNAKTLMK